MTDLTNPPRLVSPDSADVGVVGLAVMGANLARNLASRGNTVAVYNRTAAATQAFIAARAGAGEADQYVATVKLEDMVAALKAPRRVLLMVKAGKPVDAVIEALIPLLSEGDVIIDGGNSHYEDTERREAKLAAEGLHFVGMGVSGGEEGALNGPSMMPGGPKPAWDAIQPLFEPAAAHSDSGACVTHCGTGGAGHFVKMAHNGIEYGDMQLIAEAWSLLRASGHSPAEQRAVFETWEKGPLSSFLVELTAGLVAAADPKAPGAPLIDAILDEAGQKGTGRWTAITATERGVPVPTISAAVDGRALSSARALRAAMHAAYKSPIDRAALAPVTPSVLEAALLLARLTSYDQGLALIREASRAADWGTDLAEVARIWTGGCIIRAALLADVYAAFKEDPELPSLLLAPAFTDVVTAGAAALRTVVAAAVTAGVPVPGFSSALAAFDTLRTAPGTAALIQAQRDAFGAHTFRRQAAPDEAEHAQWDALDQLA